MNLKQMEYFITIVNEGSISAASKILHISQPPLSTQMKLLEQELGVTLFERGSRAIALTHAGKVFYDRAQGILDMTGAARQELEQMGRGLHGFLRHGFIHGNQFHHWTYCGFPQPASRDIFPYLRGKYVSAHG